VGASAAVRSRVHSGFAVLREPECCGVRQGGGTVPVAAKCLRKIADVNSWCGDEVTELLRMGINPTLHNHVDFWRVYVTNKDVPAARQVLANLLNWETK
jgi:hypothetical protein